ncbi:MAG: hypothetical protein Q8K33_01750 [Cypionkella sp.]|uniref:DUF1281 family ferredoxin-like fold protein n=1 Tax=Cypionkella sp. TaxID=2811411 RepID=UPI00273026FB|nr:hypothetical protein [Cypionkella sp.]MDP2047606.1 hypothetical protein [Cypionkella sp.]
MPNHVFNEVRLHGVNLDTVKPLIMDKTGQISFAVLVPLPINFWPGSVGSQHEKAFPGTHLDAATKSWGTKWNCYGDPDAVQDGDDTLITFKTAWAPPRGWIVALFNTLECKITSKWLDEGRIDAFSETYVMENKRFCGPSWETEVIHEKSDEHRRLHKCLWGVEAHEDEESE